MSISLRSFFSQANTDGAIYLDFFDYAKTLFNSGNEDIYLKPETFISIFSQAEGLLSPDVLDIYATPFYKSYLNQENQLIESLKGKRTSFALKKIVAQEKPKFIVSEIITALKSLYTNRPFVLTIDSPQKWLQETHDLMNPDREAAISTDELERASMYIAELLRSYSTLGVNAIVLRESEDSILSHEEVIAIYQPILNIVSHYKWSLGVQFEKGIIPSAEISNKVDFYLFQSLGLFETATNYWKRDQLVGGGLNNEFWSGNQRIESNFQKGLYFGKIPPKAEPETVLAQLKALRA